MPRLLRNALTLALLTAAAAPMGCESTRPRAGQSAEEGNQGAALRLLVMDPLALPLACDCVQGHAQRDYDRLATFLEGHLRRPVEIAHTESLPEALRANPGKVHLIVGKRSVVVFDAAGAGVSLRPIAMLTDKTGRTDLTGLVVVRSGDPAGGVAGLKGRRILLGPADSDERHAAAKAYFRSEGVSLPADAAIAQSCNEAAVAVVEKQADAAVISSYALPLLEGCDTIDRGSLRVLGRTGPVPFITVFATAAVGPADEPAVRQALLAVRAEPDLLAAMESKDGFVSLPAARAPEPAGASPARPRP